VTHDLTLLLEFADRVAIMYGGRVVEVGPAQQIYDAPLHPYTRGLRDSFPPLRSSEKQFRGIPGAPPDPRIPMPGCAFSPRCPVAIDRCTVER
ncbi:oligopeptide/dipeptide ABC transporter ATP-binding protein, partial [Mycobacterium kansasii]